MKQKETKYRDFTTIREDFSTYKIENGLYLRAKQILTTIRYDPSVRTEKGDYKYEFGLQTISHVEKRKPIDTSKLENADPSNVTEKNEIGRLKFKPIREIVNIYETDKSLIFLNMEVVEIKSTNKKDHNDIPIVRFNSRTGLKVEGKRPNNSKTDAKKTV